ncbi:MAG TPA: hypothetical protein VGS11_04615 [Candidatus Bathyarchaeia archaeon]|nr:hypothetical protein [Candidatus Bathyarchaeia archaeon]
MRIALSVAVKTLIKMIGRTPRILFGGLMWGIFEALVILWIFPSETSFQSVGSLCCERGAFSVTDEIPRAYVQALAGSALWLVLCLAALMGYLFKDHAAMIRAILIAQFASGVILLEWSGWELVFLPALLVLLFFFGIVSGLLGGLLSERMLPSRQL